MPLDPASHVPIYEQIVEHICGCVASGVYRPGEVLPSTRALALELVVNPNTIQRAYQELERQGVLYTRKGLGAFVADNGHTSAQDKSEAGVRARFAEGVGLARAAEIPTRRIKTIFSNALTTSDAAPTEATKDQP